MIIILLISINLILSILLFIAYCVHVLYVRFDMCKINDSQSVSQSVIPDVGILASESERCVILRLHGLTNEHTDR